MISAVIFDLDGTLVDTPRAILETIQTVLAARGSPADASLVRPLIGLPLEQQFSALLDLPPSSAEVGHAVQAYRAVFSATVVPRAHELLFPGVADGLETLRAAGLRLAIATSKIQRTAAALLAGAGIERHFALVLGTDQVQRPKPDPEMVQRTLEALDTAPAQAIVVGDTTHDLLMAQRAGVPGLGVTYGVHSAEQLGVAAPVALADTFAEVVAYLLRHKEATQ